MQNPVFELWVPAGGSGTPPMHSNVFVSVFDLRLEFARAPVVASAAENEKIIGNFSACRRHSRYDSACQQRQSKAKTEKCVSERLVTAGRSETPPIDHSRVC